MNVLWYLPLERVDMRYTTLMDDDIVLVLNDFDVTFSRIYPDSPVDDGKVPTGQFLDWAKTSAFKAAQLELVARRFHCGDVSDGDAFFVSDLWYPGIESIRYMAELSGIEVTIHGIMHAGSWIPSDDVAKLSSWVRNSERGWFDLATTVFVGSHFHKQLILDSGLCKDESKLIVEGLPFPMDPILEAGFRNRKAKRQPRMVCTGRLHSEKRHDLFKSLESLLTYKGSHIESFVTTHELNLSKDEYFDLLSTSEFVFSAAEQENFGYGVLEAVALGCIPIVPDALSYREMYPKVFRYKPSDMLDAAATVKKLLANKKTIGRTQPSLALIAGAYADCTERIIKRTIERSRAVTGRNLIWRAPIGDALCDDNKTHDMVFSD